MLTLMAVIFSCQVSELLPGNATCSHRGKLSAMKMQASLISFKDVITLKKNLLQIEYGAVTLATKCK